MMACWHKNNESVHKNSSLQGDILLYFGLFMLNFMKI